MLVVPASRSATPILLRVGPPLVLLPFGGVIVMAMKEGTIATVGTMCPFLCCCRIPHHFRSSVRNRNLELFMLLNWRPQGQTGIIDLLQPFESRRINECQSFNQSITLNRIESSARSVWNMFVRTTVCTFFENERFLIMWWCCDMYYVRTVPLCTYTGNHECFHRYTKKVRCEPYQEIRQYARCHAVSVRICIFFWWFNLSWFARTTKGKELATKEALLYLVFKDLQCLPESFLWLR